MDQHSKMRKAPAYRPWRAGAILLAVLAVALFYVVTRTRTHDARSGQADRTGPDWNVLIVSFDTTRADHLGAFGYERARTPTVDGLADRGIRFTRCFAPVPMTLPSHASLLTGLYPFRHQLHTNRDGPLHVAIPTLAEAMKQHGARTGAVVAAAVLSADRGLSRGFEHYDDVKPVHDPHTVDYAARRGETVTDAGIEWLKTLGESRWFLWAHYYDPHVPYDAPGTPSNASLDRAYDLEITYADAQLGRLLDYVSTLGASTGRPTAVVFVADHGESLGEHDESTHGLLTYNTTLHVPLIFALPSQSNPGTAVDRPVSLVDVTPTVLGWFAKSAMPAVDGSPIVDERGVAMDLPDDRAIYFESTLARRWYNWSELRGDLLGDWKLIFAPKPELYNLRLDPQELHNVYSEQPDVVDRMRDRYAAIANIQELLAQYHESGDNLAPEQRRELASLGYLGEAQNLQYDARDARDPKDFVYVHELYVRGRASIARGDLDEGLQQYKTAFGADPDNPQLIGQFVRLLNVEGARDRASAILLARLDEDRPMPAPLGVSVRVQLAIMMGREKRFADAEKLLQKALELDPNDHDANYYYAQALLMMGKPSSLAQPYLDKAEKPGGDGT